MRKLSKVLLALVVVGAPMAARATGTADADTMASLDNIQATIVAGFGIVTAIITASLGIRMYRKLGKRGIGAA